MYYNTPAALGAAIDYIVSNNYYDSSALKKNHDYYYTFVRRRLALAVSWPTGTYIFLTGAQTLRVVGPRRCDAATRNTRAARHAQYTRLKLKKIIVFAVPVYCTHI